MSWHDYGCPIWRDEQIDELLTLLRTWYTEYHQLNGGFLHVWTEDGNLDDESVLPANAFDCAFVNLETEVDRQHAEGYLPRTITADIIEKHMRRIIGSWQNMDEPHRYAAHAWHHGDAQKLLAGTPPWDAWDATTEHLANVHPNSTWAKLNQIIDTTHGRYTHDIRSSR